MNNKYQVQTTLKMLIEIYVYYKLLVIASTENNIKIGLLNTK